MTGGNFDYPALARSPQRPPASGPQQFDRRTLLGRGLALALSGAAGGWLLSGCGDGGGMMGDRMPDWMMSGNQMMDAAMMDDMRVIRTLLQAHEQIDRDVENIPGGIRSHTTSGNREIADLIVTHVGQMKRRVERGDPIRRMDPLFREIFEHHTKIEMQTRPIDGGVLVVETSPDPQVNLLIRQHAHQAVSEFVAEGMSRAMRPTPLPRGYRA